MILTPWQRAAVMGVSPWTPAALGPVLWAEGDTTAHPDALHLTGGNVDTFTDLSGSGNHLLQAVPGSRPLAVASGSGYVLRFDGTADRLKTAPFTLNQPCHYFVLAKWTNVPGSTRYLWDGNAVTQGALINNDASFPGKATPHAGSYGPQQAFTTATWYIWDVELNNASTKIGLDGGAQSSGIAGASNPGGFVIGASGNEAVFAAADVAGIVIVNRISTATERALTVAYLQGLRTRLAI